MKQVSVSRFEGWIKALFSPFFLVIFLFCPLSPTVSSLVDETTREHRQLRLELETLLRLQIDGRFFEEEGGGGAEEGPGEGPRCLSCHFYPLLLISCCWYGSDKLRGPAKNELHDDTRWADQPLRRLSHTGRKENLDVTNGSATRRKVGNWKRKRMSRRADKHVFWGGLAAAAGGLDAEWELIILTCTGLRRCTKLIS